jgi:hypothetical protein
LRAGSRPATSAVPISSSPSSPGPRIFVIVGCVWAYARRTDKRVADLGGFVVAFALTTAFFAADMAIFQPRYLPLFPAMLHPHSP